MFTIASLKSLLPVAPLAPLAALLALAAAIDLRHRRIPNWLTLAMAVSGLAQSLLPGTHLSPGSAVLGLLTGVGLLIVPFVLQALGGGDVKLLGAVGAWLGPWLTLEVFVVCCVVGMVIVLAQATAEGRLRTLFRNSALLTLNIAQVDRLGAEHVAATGAACGKTARQPLPFAVPVLISVSLVLWWSGGMR
jgi:prepilin peptidase CpaA